MIKKIDSGTLFVNDNFYIRIDSKKKFSFKRISGKKINIEESLEVFLHKVNLKGKIFWTVSESMSGCRLAKLHKKPNKAIQKAKEVIEFEGVDKIKTILTRQIKSSSISPRFRFIVNPTRQKICGILKA